MIDLHKDMLQQYISMVTAVSKNSNDLMLIGGVNYKIYHISESFACLAKKDVEFFFNLYLTYMNSIIVEDKHDNTHVRQIVNLIPEIQKTSEEKIYNVSFESISSTDDDTIIGARLYAENITNEFLDKLELSRDRLSRQEWQYMLFVASGMDDYNIQKALYATKHIKTARQSINKIRHRIVKKLGIRRFMELLDDLKFYLSKTNTSRVIKY